MVFEWLRVDDHDPPQRVALVLPGEERRGQLELARWPERVGGRVEDQHDPRRVEVFLDACGDAACGREGLVKPHAKA